MSLEQIETGSVIEHPSGAHRTDQLRIISWNIERGIRFDAITRFLSGANADLVLLQEVDKNCRRTGNRDVAKELSARLEMNYVYGVEFQELTQGSQGSPAYHGQATLSPWPLQNPRVLHFRNQSKFWNPSWWIPMLPPFQRRLGDRMALVTDVCAGPMRVTAYNLHLESRNGDHLRNMQLREALSDAAQREQQCPVIIGGDFNFDVARFPQSAAISDAGFKNLFLGPRQPTVVKSNRSGGALDCILVRGDFQSVTANVHTETRSSDHYPLCVTVLFDGGKSSEIL